MAVDYRMKIKASDNTSGAFKKVNKNVNTTTSAVKKLAGAFAGAFAVRQIVQFGNEALQVADTIGKVADSIGVNVEFLQRFQFAAQQAGLTTEEFNKGMQNFTKMVGQAQLRTSEAGRTLEKLGVQVKNADGSVKGAEEVFVDLFHALDGVGSQFEKNAILADLMGRAGVKLSVMGKAGAEAMEELAASATGVFTEDTVRKAEAFNDTMNRLKRQVMLPLKTAFIDTAKAILNFAEAMGLIKPDLFTKSMDELNILLDEQKKKRDELIAQQEGFLDVFKGTIFEGTVPKQIEDTKKLIIEIEKMIASKTKQEEIQKKLNESLALGNEEGEEQINQIKDTIQVVKTFADTIEGKLTTAFTDFFDIASDGFGDFKQLATSIIRAIIAELIQMFIVQKAVGMVKGALSAPDLSGGFLGTPDISDFEPITFAGGGYTGMGARAGGLDGKGGFLAMMHPRETVIDHTKGQGMGATVNFNISTVDAAGFDELLATRKNMIISMVNQAYNSRGKMGIA